MRKKYKFALLGTPIEHSLSPEIHKIFAEGCGIEKNFEYVKIDTDKTTLKETVEYLKSSGFSGFNCTMPLKEEIMNYVDEKSGNCKLLKVCNTVKINRDKTLSAYTTDGSGMVSGIEYNGVKTAGKNILVFGAGGTTKSVVLSLVESGAENIIVLNRSEKNLNGIKKLFSVFGGLPSAPRITFDLLNLYNIEKYIKDFDIDILINTSQLGMKGFEESPAFDPEYKFLDLLKNDAAIADSVYNPLKTKLLNAAENAGLKAIDGFWMLVYQGAFAFMIWTGKEIPEAYIEKAHGVIKR